MSLVAAVKTPGTPLRAFFEDRFPNPGAVRAELRRLVGKAATIEPADREGYPWGTVGAAFDYRLRFCFPAAAELARRWETWVEHPEFSFGTISDLDNPLPQALAAERSASISSSTALKLPWVPAIAPFFGSLAVLLKRTAPWNGALATVDEEMLCRHCFVLGLFDELARSSAAWGLTPLLGVPANPTAGDMLALCPATAVADLSALVHAFISSNHGLLAGKAVLNPVFADSRLVGGADGDLIVDGGYIDIKATREPGKVSPSAWPWEILGYVLLDVDDSFGIRSLGLYLARQVLLLTWPVEDFMALLVAPGAAVPTLEHARHTLHDHLIATPTSPPRAHSRSRDTSAR